MPTNCEDCMEFFRACVYLDKAIPVYGYPTNADRIRAATDEILRLRAELAKRPPPSEGNGNGGDIWKNQNAS